MSAGPGNKIDSPAVKGITGKFTPKLFDWFPDKPSIKKILVLVFPKNIHDYYASFPSKLREDLASGSLLTLSVGHCYISWDYTKGIIGLWDMCLHEQVDYKYLSSSGYGSMALSAIIYSLIVELPNYGTTTGILTDREEKWVVKIWLGVDMSNVRFSNVIHLYTKYGFNTPIVKDTDPFGNDLSSNFPNGLLGLSRNNEFIVDSDIDREMAIKEIIYALQEAIGNFGLPQLDSMSPIIGSNDLTKDGHSYCKMSIKFDLDNISLLKTFSIGSSTMNYDGTATRREVSGSFSISKNTAYIRVPYTLDHSVVPGQILSLYVGDPAIKHSMDILYKDATEGHKMSIKSMSCGSREKTIRTLIDENYNNILLNLGYVHIEIKEGQVPGVTYEHVTPIPDNLPTVHSKIIVWGLQVEIDSLGYGTEVAVLVPDTKYSFHTHTKSFYLTSVKDIPMDKITIGQVGTSRRPEATPSGMDYWAILDKILISKISFHTVVAPNGVYIISMHQHWLEKTDELVHRIYSDPMGTTAVVPKKEILAWGEEATKRESTATGSLKMDEESTLRVLKAAVGEAEVTWEDMIKEMYTRYWVVASDELSTDDACRKYCDIITETRSLGYDQAPPIKAQFRSWDELSMGNPIDIDYQSLGKNCIPTQKDTETYNRFYGHKL